MRKKYAEKDFTGSGLPKNRKEVFFDSLKMRYGLILSLGLRILLFSLPILILYVIKDIMTLSYNDMLEDSSITELEYTSLINSTKVIFSFIAIPCWVLISLGFAGATRIIRKLVWQEGIFSRYDFNEGIKIYGKKFIFVFGIGSLIYALNTFVSTFASYFEFLGYIPNIIMIFLLLPIAMYTLSEIVFYNDKMKVLIKNGLSLYIQTLPSTLIFIIVLMVPFFLSYLSLLIITKYLIIIILIIFALPIYLLAWIINSLRVFDKYINKEHFKEIYMKGIYRPEEK